MSTNSSETARWIICDKWSFSEKRLQSIFISKRYICSCKSSNFWCIRSWIIQPDILKIAFTLYYDQEMWPYIQRECINMYQRSAHGTLLYWNVGEQHYLDDMKFDVDASKWGVKIYSSCSEIFQVNGNSRNRLSIIDD